MNLSVSTWNYLCSYGEKADLEQAVSEIKADGFGVELWLGWRKADPKAFERERLDAVKELVADASALSAHKSGSGFDSLRKDIDIASHVGAGTLVIHAKSLDMLDPAETATFRVLRDVVVYACEKGVVLALENGAPWILRQAAEICGVSICVDVGHANCDLDPRRWSPRSVLQDFARQNTHVHLHDNEGLIDSHMVPGDGSLDWASVVECLKKQDFSGQCVLELNTPNARESALRAREYLMKLWDAAA